MSKHGHNETLNFSGSSGYYGSIIDGYGGFDWGDLDYLNQNGAKGDEPSGTGFQNSPHSWAILPGVDGQYASGLIASTQLSETFNLRSMVAASGGQANEHIYLRTYTYGTKGFALKASDTITLSQTAEQIDFAKLGNGDDFKNISAIVISDYNGGSYGGHGTGAPGYVLKFTDLKVHWNGKIPSGDEAGASHPVPSGAHHAIALHLAASDAVGSICQHSATDAAMVAYHSSVASLDGALGHAGFGDSLTSQFVLPQIEHFGP